MAKKRRKRGKPPKPKYSKKLAKAICERIALGESIRTITKDENMPVSSTIFLWLLDDKKKEFQDMYKRAKDIQAELMFEEILEIADDGTNDWMTIKKKGGSYTVLNKEAVMRSRLRVDTRKWHLSKLLPKKFGEKLDLTSDNKPLQSNTITFVDFSNESKS